MMATRYREADTHDTLWPEDRIETLLPSGCFDAEPAGERYTRLLRAERLQLPEPAGTLWTRVREPLHEANARDLAERPRTARGGTSRRDRPGQRSRAGFSRCS